MNSHRIFRTSLLLMLVSGLIITACSPQTAPAPPIAPTAAVLPPPETGETVSPTQSTSAEPLPASSQAITFLYPQAFNSLNPLYIANYFERISQQLWNAWAWDFDEQNRPHPVLVKEIPSLENGGISADGRVITLHLKEGLLWSDGAPLTSDDFLFTYEMYLSSNNTVPNREPYSLLESLQTPDETTVVMTFSTPYAPWAATLWQGLLPAHILRPVFQVQGSIDNAEWNKAPTVGCGPFVFAEWVAGSHVRFVANPNYWLGLPKLAEITIRFVSEVDQVSALTSGQGDLGTFFSFSDIPTLEAAGLRVYRIYSGYNEGLQFYLNPIYGHPALQDIRVRQAIAMAIDRQALINSLLGGQTQPAISYWDNTPYIDPTLTVWPYDVARANALLDESGWLDNNGDGVRDQDGVDFELSYGATTREVRQKAQAMIRDQLAQVGIRLVLSDYEPDIFYAGYSEGGPAATGQLDMFQLSSAYRFPDPDTADFLCSQLPSMENPGGVNWIAFCNQELNDLLVKQASQVGYPDTDRQATFHQISRIIYERAYFIGLWQDPDVWALNSRLENVELSGVTPFYNIAEWVLAQ